MNTSKKLVDDIRNVLRPVKSDVKRPAKGFLKYDYLVPSGYYKEQWDWDAFFMGVALASEISSEGIYIRNWALNYLNAADKKGFTAGCVTPKGPEKGHRLFLMKPFLAQGIFLASTFLDDYPWVKPHWSTLKKVVLYRQKHRWSKEYGLVVLKNSMETGADDNVAAFDFPDNTIIAADFNTYTLREYKAMSLLAKHLGKTADHKVFQTKYQEIKKNMLRYLWHNEDKVFYNRSIETDEYIKRITFSNFVPLWDGVVSAKSGQESIRRYMLNSKHLWSKYGVRTLSKSDPDYNNVNRIKPYSNWQGPVWPIANYIYMQGLLRYGFQKEALVLAERITKLVLADIKKTGGMHENYDAETGKPLAAPNFVSWNLLVSNMIEEAVANKNPFEIQ